MVRYIIIFVLLGASSIDLLKGQTEPKATRFVDVTFHFGANYYPGGELEDELANGYKGLDIRYGWQANNSEHWTGVFNYANYGVGLWSSHIGPSDILGNPMALYGFVNFPLYRSKKFELLVGPAFGLAFNLKPYDETTNPQNDLTGGHAAAFFNPSISIAYSVNETLDLRLGGNFIHMSNGGFAAPNTGYDMYGFNLGLRYHLNRQLNGNSVNYSGMFPEKRIRNKNKSSSINIYQGFGRDQRPDFAGNIQSYLISSSTIEYQYQFNEIHGLTAGLNVFYDESSQLMFTYPRYETSVFPAIHLGYDFHFWRLAIRPQFGYMLTEAGRSIKSTTFVRLALSADITRTLYFQMAVKTIDGFKADWGNFGFGVRLFKQ